MTGAHGVAAAGVVDVAPLIRRQQVIAAVVHAAVAVGRAVGAGFVGVVVDDVEPHLDPGGVKRLHHRPEFVERVAVRVRLMGREEMERHVAPVVALLRIELVNRQQLDNRDAELLEIRNLLRQPGKRTAPGGRDARVGARGKSLDVQFVDDRVRPGVPRTCFGSNGDRRPLRQTAERRTPVGRPSLRARVAAERGWKEHRRRVGIEQDLLRIEPASPLGLVRTFDTVGIERRGVELARRNPAMPDVPRLVRRMAETQFKSRLRGLVLVVTQEADAGGVSRVQRKIERVLGLDPLNPQRPGTSRLYHVRLFQLCVDWWMIGTQMILPSHKTKIVATIGPASESPDMLERLIRAGLDIARLNFSHGDFTGHAERIAGIRAAADAAGRRVAIMADLPGPKMRIGRIEPEPIQLLSGDPFTLTTEDIVGDQRRVSMSFERLPRVVKRGDQLFLNDGLIQLVVERVTGNDVLCTVAVGGELRSRKGLNLSGIDLGISAFTEHDRDCLEFALAHGVDAVSQSFVETAADVDAVRAAAKSFGREPLVIAKIERADALRHIDDILNASDGIMVARGDLGVELPVEQIAVIQKDLIARAGRVGKPVITATQMLESMTASRLPTRAESTDVANAILDGTDCIMLSGESAMGKYPEEAVAMLAKIAAYTEQHRASRRFGLNAIAAERRPASAAEAMASVVENALSTVPFAAVFVPSMTGSTARMISRFNPAVWIVAVSHDHQVCQNLAFSYGVHPVHIAAQPDDWNVFAQRWIRQHEVPGTLAMLVAGPSTQNPADNHRLEFLRLEEPN